MALAETRLAETDLTLDANFRAWVLAVRTALTDAGIIRTTDTGQIDPTTVTSPAASTYAGYDIFRFPDSADQTLYPIFFKLEYGKGSVIAKAGLKITIGTGSNGSGTILGADATQTISPQTANPTGGAYLGASYFDGGLVLHNPMNYSGEDNGRTSFMIERIRRRTDGVVTQGVQFIGWTLAAASPFVTRVLNNGWGAGTLAGIMASFMTGGSMSLGGLWAPEYASATFRSVAFARPGILSIGDAGTVVAEDGTIQSYKKIATLSTQLLVQQSGVSQTHDILLRSA